MTVSGKTKLACAALLMAMLGIPAAAQGGYQPKFHGDPAHSKAEAVALGYMRTVLTAQREYKKKRGYYASSLAALVHSGSFTRRMVKADRGDYTVHFRGSRKQFSLALTPKQFDTGHRAFYVDESGKFRVEEDKPAGPGSEVLK